MFSYSTDTIVESGVKHKIGYDVQSIIPSYCCTIRHIVSDTRTRKYHPLTYRQIHTSKDTYRHSFFLYTIPQWNQLPINTLPSVVSFREQLTPAVLCNLL